MKLPQKYTYPLEEIAKIWDCTAQDILQYWIEDKLHLCIFIVPPTEGLRVIQTCRDVNSAEGILIERIIEEIGHTDDELSGAYYIDPQWEKEVNGELYQGRKFEFYSDILITPRYFVDNNGGYDEYFMVFRDDGDVHSNRLFDNDEMEIGISDICITHHERIRFEQFCKEQSIDKSHKEETTLQRKERLKKRKIELQNKGVKDFNKQIAREEGISVQRVKQLTSSS